MILETATLLSIGSYLGNKISDKGFNTIYSKLTKSDKFNKKFYKAVEKISKTLQAKYPDVLGGSIEYFFKKEEIFGELVKLLFKNSVVDKDVISSHFDTESLPQDFIYEFVTLLRKELGTDLEFSEILADKEIFVLLQGLEQDIETISKNSTLTQSEISKLRHYLEQKIGNEFSFNKFLGDYKKNALQSLSQVNFIGLGVDSSIKRKGKNLQDVFVKPYFKIINKNYINNKNEGSLISKRGEKGITSYINLFDYSNKVVVLGNPGSGKSILVKSIICDIIEQDQDSFNNKDVLRSIPFRIELRRYLSFKKQNKGNILKYLVFSLEEEYGISNITEVILDRILLERDSFIFFDGLDEIFKVEDKIAIKNDIENFHTPYTLAKSLTTSRIIGYEEAKLEGEQFCELTIQNFDDEQIKEYIEKWYKKEEENLEIREKEVAGFLTKQHEIDRELITNPLLLSLIVILYRNILKLPESKLEIYQSCTKTLVDKWDASKDLSIDLEPEIIRNKEKILADLAHWQYEQLSSESAIITYEKARNTVVRTLQEKLNIADDFNGEDLAESFMIYAQKRSIYFDNNFTHKTFLEYYTAYWIYSNIEKKHKIIERNKIISKYISNSYWHIVLELLLNMIDKDQADAEIMDNLLSSQIKAKSSSLPFVLSTINSFKNVSKSTLVNVINISIEFLLESISLKRQRKPKAHLETLESKVFESLRDAYHSDPIIKELVLDKLKTYVNAPNEISNASFLLSMEIYVSYREPRIKFVPYDMDLYVCTINSIAYAYVLNAYLFLENTNNSYLDITLGFIKNFGIRALFTTNIGVFDPLTIGAFINFYLQYQIRPENIKAINNNLEQLEKNGLTKRYLIKNIQNKNGYYSSSNEITLPLIDKLNEENDDQVDVILVILLYQNLEGPYRINLINGITFEEVVEKVKKKDFFLRIYNALKNSEPVLSLLNRVNN